MFCQLQVTLDYAECSEVLKRWADHLASPQINQKDKAILILLSLGQFLKVIELLYGLRHFDRAALFIEAFREFNLLDVPEDSPAATLIQMVFLEYARFLLNLGMREACDYYCRQAGSKGKQLLAEIQQPASTPE